MPRVRLAGDRKGRGCGGTHEGSKAGNAESHQAKEDQELPEEAAWS